MLLAFKFRSDVGDGLWYVCNCSPRDRSKWWIHSIPHDGTWVRPVEQAEIVVDLDKMLTLKDRYCGITGKLVKADYFKAIAKTGIQVTASELAEVILNNRG